MSVNGRITKDNIDQFFHDLSKEIRKEFGKNIQLELIVVGGASVLLNYNFRESTQDIDALVYPPMSIRDAINRVGDKYGLENGWINSDFKHTRSYSTKLRQYSQHYKKYNHILSVWTVGSEYLVAMKLASLREYKNDKSDIAGILASDKDITLERIDTAVKNLYDGWDHLPENAKECAEMYVRTRDTGLYQQIRNDEMQNQSLLSNFEKKYENVLSDDNIDSILQTLKQKESLQNAEESKSETVEEILAHQKDYDFDELLAALQRAQKIHSQNKTVNRDRYQEDDRDR